MKKWYILGISLVCALGLVGLGFALSNQQSDVKTNKNESTSHDDHDGHDHATHDHHDQDMEAKDSTDHQGSLAPGRYIEFSKDELSNVDYDKTILFFHAPWCVECRGFENAIKSGDIPDGAQILKVDYDSSMDLRKQYGVTIQSTFVRVGGEGSRQKLWVGYGKDKSVDEIIRNTQ